MTLNRDPLFPHTHESEASCAICWWLRKKRKRPISSYEGASESSKVGASEVSRWKLTKALAKTRADVDSEGSRTPPTGQCIPSSNSVQAERQMAPRCRTVNGGPDRVNE